MADFVIELANEGGKLTASEAVTIVLLISGVLVALEDKGILHRDLKFDNFMLAPDEGRIILLDFGLAKETVGLTNLSLSAETFVNLDYLAPELVLSSSAVPNIQSEIFALGITLIKMFNPLLVRFKTEEEFVSWLQNPIVKISDDIPRSLCPLLEAMVACNPQQRFWSFRQVNVVCQHLLLKYADRG